MRPLKTAVAFPPLEGPGIPLLSQNRQFQWFKDPSYIYPVIPAYCATMLKEAGHQVVWLDGIVARQSLNEWYSYIINNAFDVVVIETKTPAIKQHWQIIDYLKGKCPTLRIILCGDHVTALPEESFKNSRVDYVVTGGDYDFLVKNICDVISGVTDTYEKGIWYRTNDGIKNTGDFILSHDLSCLPHIDRDLTQWKLYSTYNGNFRKTPGAYIMAGRDCWYHKCSFCSWTTLYPTFRSRPVNDVVDEIETLVNEYGVKEIMDDTGTFPVGPWLHEFCEEMIRRGLNTKVSLDCNMRLGVLTAEEYALMKRAGFRLLLVGIESANQETLKRISKGMNIDTAVSSCKLARESGLYPHITIMFGYPWETEGDAQRTLALGKMLLKKGYAYTVQGTLMIPYPGTLLYEECKKEGWLLSTDWNEYDMQKPIMKTPFLHNTISAYVRNLYAIAFHPAFLWRRICGIKSGADIRYFIKAGRKVCGHFLNFSAGKDL